MAQYVGIQRGLCPSPGTFLHRLSRQKKTSVACLGKDHRGVRPSFFGLRLWTSTNLGDSAARLLRSGLLFHMGLSMKCPECSSRIPAASSVCPSCGAALSPDRRPDPKEGGTGNEQRLTIANYGIPIARENLKGVIVMLIIAIVIIALAALLFAGRGGA